jgi:uncharacterized delta-60 repeat protein
MRTRTVRRRHLALEPLEGRALLTAGALDTTFGGTGMLLGPAGESNAVAVQPDLKVVVAGATSSNGISRFTIARYNSDGGLDTTFGNGGIATPALTTTMGAYAYAVAIQPTDGKIVVAGHDWVAGSKKGTSVDDWAIVRLNTNGTLDTTFGGGKGYVLTSFGAPVSTSQVASAIAIQPDGKIVAAGQATVNGSGGVALARYNADGSLDTSFGTGGTVGVTGMTWAQPGQMVAIDSAGRVDVVGCATVGTTAEMEVTRYSANGTKDTTFGTGGVVNVMPSDASAAIARSVGLQSTGKIVVYGQGNYAGVHNFVPALVRLNGDGSLDSTFGAGGTYTDARMSFGTSMVIQPDDKIVAVANGYSNGSRNYQYLVTRVLADGSGYDPAFGTAGLGTAFANDTQGWPSSVALAPDGKIVTTGNYDNYSQFATARFLGDPLATTTSLSSSLDPSTAGQPVTFPATVAAAFDTPTGTVSFYDGTTLLGTVTIVLVNGVPTATFTTSTLSSGTHSITAVYGGDSNDQGSTSGVLSQQVN